MELFLGDCFEHFDKIKSESVDFILVDPPYGTTACKWDSVLPFDLFWKNANRVIKKNGAIAVFGSEPFSSALRMSNIKNFKYDWIWVKNRPNGMCNAKIRPMQKVEIVSVFGHKHNYFPQMEKLEKIRSGKVYGDSIVGGNKGVKAIKKYYSHKFPNNVLFFDKLFKSEFHQTQKPIPLLEYLIKTYTLENETVLDFTMGSGSTGVACKNLNRKFIGIEKDKTYFEIAQKRISEAGQCQQTY